MAYNTFGRYRYTNKDSAMRVRKSRVSLVSSCNTVVPMTNDDARKILYHARLYLLPVERGLTVRDGQLVSVEQDAIQLLAGIEMGLAYNVTAPGRGI